MRIFIITLILFLFNGQLLAQNKVDSLTQLTRSEKDTSRFFGYLRLSEHFLRKSMDSSKVLLRNAKKVLPQIQKNYQPKVYDYCQSEYLRQTAIKFHVLDQYDSAAYYYQQAQKVFQKRKHYKRQEQIINNLGVLYEDQGEYKTALKYYYKLLELAKKNNHVKETSRALVNIGVVNYRMGENEEALTYYKKALPLKKQLGLKKSTALLYNNIGIVYYLQGNYEKVLEYFKRSLNIYRQIGDERGQARPYFNIAEIYDEMRKNKQALYYYKKCYEIETKFGDKSGQASTLSSIGLIYADLEQYSDALRVQKKAIDILKSIDSKVELADVCYDISIVYEAKGDFKNALKWFKEHKKIQDSLFTAQKSREIAEVKEQYKAKQKDQKIALLEEQNKLNQLENEKHEQEAINKKRIAILSLIIAALGLFGLVMIYRLYTQKKRANKLLEWKNESITQKNEEIGEIIKRLEKDLRAQEYFFIKSIHEFRTPLNIIAGFANLLEQNPNQQQIDYVEHIKTAAGQLLRLTNNLLIAAKFNSGKIVLANESISLKDLSEYTKKVFGFLAEQRNIKLSYTIPNDCPDIIETDPYRYFQMLSNIVETAIAYTSQHGEVHFRFFCEQNTNLVLDVSNTGNAPDDPREKEIFQHFEQVKQNIYSSEGNHPIGLKIVMKLVDLFRGSIYVNNNLNQGTTITIKTPVETTQQTSFIFQSNTIQSAALTRRILRILIAEDDQINLKLLKDMISTYNPGILFDEASNGSEAIKKLNNKNYDLLIADLKMPEMDGFELTHQLRNSTFNANQNIPILAVSAEPHHKVSHQCIEAGMNGFIEKPGEPSKLIYEIERLTDHVPVAFSPNITETKANTKTEKTDDFGSAQNKTKYISTLFDKLNVAIRNKQWEDMIKYCSDLRYEYSLQLGRNIMKNVNNIERECVTSQNLDNIHRYYSEMKEEWNVLQN